MNQTVRNWIEQGTVDIFLGYRLVEGHPLPYVFSRDNLEELDELIPGPARYPLEKIAAGIISEKPGIKVGMLGRDCNQRALNILHIWNQLDTESICVLNVNCCPSNLREHSDCSYLDPEKRVPNKRKYGVDNNMSIEEIESYNQKDRFTRWLYEFQKCIKCYGCRNICPVCFCKECSLEHQDLITSHDLPPEIPIFHLVRAVHMAGRCIDCGLCEDVCPADIPLRLLYRKVNQIVKDIFGYETGTSSNEPPFSVLGEKVVLEPKPLKDLSAAS